MRGSPLLRALFAFVLVAAAGWPLWTLTRPVAIAANSGPPLDVPDVQAIGLQITFTTIPTSFVVRHLEKDVWAEKEPSANVEREVALDFPESGVEVVLHIVWPEDAPLSAARVRLTDPHGDTHERTVWGQGTVDEVLAFP